MQVSQALAAGAQLVGGPRPQPQQQLQQAAHLGAAAPAAQPHLIVAAAGSAQQPPALGVGEAAGTRVDPLGRHTSIDKEHQVGMV